MNEFRYDFAGNWYKGNTHIHSVASDGGKTFSELSAMYSGQGYDFLFRTDHWVCSDVAVDDTDYPLLWLDGIELDGTDSHGSMFHVVCLGTVGSLERERGFEYGMEEARRQGTLSILAHPHWSGNSFDDVARYQFDGIEIYNHVCRWLNGKGDGLAYWDKALMAQPATLGFAVDDAHLSAAHPGWNGGWIMVNSPDLSRTRIIEAIRAGIFYSTCGPEFLDLSFSSGQIVIETTPVQFIRLVGPGPRGERTGSFSSSKVTKAEFAVPSDWSYAYVEIEDDHGKRAWTNNLLVPKL